MSLLFQLIMGLITFSFNSLLYIIMCTEEKISRIHICHIIVSLAFYLSSHYQHLLLLLQCEYCNGSLIQLQVQNEFLCAARNENLQFLWMWLHGKQEILNILTYLPCMDNGKVWIAYTHTHIYCCTYINIMSTGTK